MSEDNGSGVDKPRIEAAVREILLAIGEDPDRDGLQNTPARVARAYEEFFSGLHADPADVLGTTFDIAHSEMVLVKDIPFYSTCEHHLVPFHGVAHVGYIPGADGKVTGLSKLARVLEVYARRPQVQERLTTPVVEALGEHLNPRGLGRPRKIAHFVGIVLGSSFNINHDIGRTHTMRVFNRKTKIY